MICVYYQPHQTDTMMKNTDISRCIPTVLIIWIRAEASVMRNTDPSLFRNSRPARHTRLWHQDSGRRIHPAAADRDESSRRYHESSSSRLRTTVMWLKPLQILQSFMMRIAWAQTCRALWVSHSDAVCTRTSLRKKLLHLHPIMTVHSNHCFPSDKSNCKINLLINYIKNKNTY